MNFKFFLLFSALLLFGVIAIQRPLPKTDLFSMPAPGSSLAPTDLLASEIFAAKLAHAKKVAKYDIGLFGNSRTLMVSASDLRIPNFRFFNFSVPGQSIRSSIELLELLAKADKAPKLILIGLDNMELEFYGNPEIRRPIRQIRLAMNDLVSGASTLNLKDRIRMTWRHLYTVGYIGILRYLSYRSVNDGLEWQYHESFGIGGWRWLGRNRGRYYRSDGSRLQLITGAVRKTRHRLPIVAPSIIGGYLAHDLKRLAQLKSSGRTRIIVFEGPLAPRLIRPRGKSSPRANALRQQFRQSCKIHMLVCMTPPYDNPELLKSGWRDASHPPAKVLGSFLRIAIQKRADIK
jgi:hypothetical protein